jgi:formate-dependent nitrite reductase membrane component NrfD
MKPIEETFIKRPKPQQHWGWIIAIYLYLAGMGAGSFIIGTIINWSIGPSLVIKLPIFSMSFDFGKAIILWGPILVAIGAPFLILDLGIKRRFLYACLNPKTSWVARGFLILSAFIILGIVTLGISIFPSFNIIEYKIFLRFIEIISFLLAFATAIYTGILLKATRSVPLWNTYFLPLLFLISALSTGSMAILLSTLGSGLLSQEETAFKILTRVEQFFVVIEALVLYIYLLKRYKLSEQGKDSVRLLLFGEKRLIFWGGIVSLGLIFPFILEIFYSLSPDRLWLIFSSGIILLCGGFFLRLGLLSAGIKDKIPMQRWIEFKYGINPIKPAH